MSHVTHHIPDDIIEAYASGTLPHAFAVVVAAHLSLCDTCRASAEACDALAGVALEALEGPAPTVALRARALARLDEPATVPAPGETPRGIYPGAVATEFAGHQPPWRAIGAGIRQHVFPATPEGSVRLLYIPGGKAVPDHGHKGLEMTLVLQGSFSDRTGQYVRGDVQVAAADLEHQPVADPGPACICLAATDAPLRFKAMIPRLLQGLFRI